MMTPLHPVRRRFSRSTFGVAAAVAIVALLLLLGRTPFSELVTTLAVPLWSASAAASETAGLRSFIHSKAALIEENDRLKRALAEQSAIRAERDVLLADNEELKSLLGRSRAEGGILAAVLVRPPISPYDTLVIDAGKSEGVSAGNRVFAGGAEFIGIVVNVREGSSVVRLQSAPGEKTGAVLLGPNVPLELFGRGGGNFEASLPRDIAVATGTPIVAPGIEASYLAVVEEVEVGDADAFQKLFARSPVNLFQLRYVLVQSASVDGL